MKADILLIEDNEQNRYLVTFLLEKAGHRVVAAPDGPSGLRMARAGSFDLVLLDIQLPGMDGYAVARALRADPLTRALCIVAVTSYAMVGDRQQSMDAGCDGYVEKPIDPATFVAEVTAHIRAGGRRTSP